ncbi:MAG: hypothetical protein GX550_08365 [Syntrophomonadaceae bacterium]|nr:hypothetical protein [Syntrophomonadaceae bacterium]
MLPTITAGETSLYSIKAIARDVLERAAAGRLIYLLGCSSIIGDGHSLMVVLDRESL